MSDPASPDPPEGLWALVFKASEGTPPPSARVKLLIKYAATLGLRMKAIRFPTRQELETSWEDDAESRETG